ncbi:hypothetical protein K7432_001907 [Basidiobolus ranarum]|uniref:DNL-type domain-containing protein n=1 Tax=Basidiobolus ranarum TaxID=34480 RepID=A0ABR2W950_9FUNG
MFRYFSKQCTSPKSLSKILLPNLIKNSNRGISLATRPLQPIYRITKYPLRFQPTSLFHHNSFLYEEKSKLDQALPEKPEPAIPGRLLIGFTCKVCKHRQHKFMSKMAYTQGVVLIQCDGCQNRHLIADNLGWFREGGVNVEDLMKEQGEDVQKLTPNEGSGDGMLEWLPTVLAQEEGKLHQQAQQLEQTKEQDQSKEQQVLTDSTTDGCKVK